jgi:hypothetical protein
MQLKMSVALLTLKGLGWYLNFFALHIKNVLFEQKKIKL